MKILGRVTGLSVALFALIGEVNRFMNFGSEFAFEFFFGTHMTTIARVIFPGSVLIAILIIAAGIYCSLFNYARSQTSLKAIASIALGLFILKPILWTVLRVSVDGDSVGGVLGEEIRTWWFNFADMDLRNTIGSTIGGVILFVALILNFILALLSKSSSAQIAHNVPQSFQPPYPQPPTYQQPQHVQPPQPQAQQSMIAELAELERMHQAGVLTSAEFTAAKKRVLGQ